MADVKFKECITFDDVLLLPGKSDFMPSEADLRTKLTREIELNIPLVSAAMDSVTESRTAICMAQHGGIGIIHRNLPIDIQMEEIRRVKKYESWMIVNPITIEPEQKIADALEVMRANNVSGVPVTQSSKLVGILTNRDLRFEKNMELKVKDLMTTKLVTVPEDIGLDEAKRLLHEHRIEKLLVVDDDGNLKGLITIKDIEKTERFPFSTKDSKGQLMVGAAVGVGAAALERAQACFDAGADVIAIDTAHGHSKTVLDMLREVKRVLGDTQVIAGNVATHEATTDLIRAGADGIKIGIGPGSICTTRIVAGVGVPQVTAIMDAAEAAKNTAVPIIADGGIKFSGDVTKAVAAGANSVMIGSIFAGTDETPGDLILYQGRSYKVYRGMGSIDAMKEGSSDRYFQEGAEESKLVPEGIEGRVPHRGPLSASIYQLMGGLKSGMGYTGCKTIDELRTRARFVRITSSGLKESHVHDVIITKEAPNYRVE